jgi:hypothetical protein
MAIAGSNPPNQTENIEKLRQLAMLAGAQKETESVSDLGAKMRTRLGKAQPDAGWEMLRQELEQQIKADTQLIQQKSATLKKIEAEAKDTTTPTAKPTYTKGMSAFIAQAEKPGFVGKVLGKLGLKTGPTYSIPDGYSMVLVPTDRVAEVLGQAEKVTAKQEAALKEAPTVPMTSVSMSQFVTHVPAYLEEREAKILAVERELNLAHSKDLAQQTQAVG